jgi:hypothetical protein
VIVLGLMGGNSLVALSNSASRSVRDDVRRRDELRLGAMTRVPWPVVWGDREASPSRIATSSVERVWPERDGCVSENVLVTSGISSDTGIITVDADPFPLRNEGMVRMEAAGEGAKDGAMATRLITSLRR